MIRIPCFLFAFFSFLPGYGADLLEERDVVYASYEERKLHLDWFRPEGEAVLPAVMVVHGGGWIGGQRSSFESIAKDIASAGFVVVNVEYRLATEAKFPGAVLDLKAAVRWVRANAEKLGIDPGRIGAVGGSAGGHLVAMLASTPDDETFPKGENTPGKSDALGAAVIMGAGVDQVARVEESKSGSIKNCVIFFGGEISEVPEMYRLGSPITHVSSDTASLLMLDGEFDRPGERYGKYREKLDEANVLNRFAMVPGAKHGEWGKAKFRSAFVAEIVRFFLEVLAP